MDEKDRPGGLTALAVINFIFAVFSLLGILGTFLSRFLISSVPMDQMSESQVAQLTALQDMSGVTLAAIACMSLISFVLLLLSGIGYLKQKKMMGRVLGSIYGAVSILYTIFSTMIFSGVFGKSFGIMSIIGLVYPVLTLLLLNIVYKNDLVY